MIKATGSQIILRLLEMEGVKYVAGIPGGQILPLYDELNKSSIKHILVRHEQAAGFIAQGMSRSTGIPAVCMATSGPGAMNLLTAIADARCDSIPIVAITGQVNTSLIGTDAFQEADTFGLSFPITKHSMMVKSVSELLTAIPLAFEIASSGRPGPVLIDVPRDVQTGFAEFEEWPKIRSTEEVKKSVFARKFSTPEDKIPCVVEEMTQVLLSAERPVLYIGGGCNSPVASFSIKTLLGSFDAVAVTSLMGIGSLPKNFKNNLGMVGMHGAYAANKAMHDADVVLAMGVRFDDRATGVIAKFCPEAKILHIDIDAAEINKILPSSCSLVCDLEAALPLLVSKIKESDDKKFAAQRKTWLESLYSVFEQTESFELGRGKKSNSVNPRKFINEIPLNAKKTGLSSKDIIVTTDVGQHQMWAAQHYKFKEPRTLLTSGGLGTMGYGLGACIGAKVGRKDKTVVNIAGDGCFRMNMNEVATATRYNIPVIEVIFNNHVLGMVRQWQDLFYGKRYSATVLDDQVDFVKVSEGMGAKAYSVDTIEEFEKAFKEAIELNIPCVIDCHIDREDKVFPMVSPGAAISEAFDREDLNNKK